MVVPRACRAGRCHVGHVCHVHQGARPSWREMTYASPQVAYPTSWPAHTTQASFLVWLGSDRSHPSQAASPQLFQSVISPCVFVVLSLVRFLVFLVLPSTFPSVLGADPVLLGPQILDLGRGAAHLHFVLACMLVRWVLSRSPLLEAGLVFIRVGHSLEGFLEFYSSLFSPGVKFS